MKKSLIFAGMLAVGYANAQYEGKVGVNTETPKATLEVQPTATNLAGTTNEGIIAPKLSKERIAAIATPVEGTLVYATDATYAGSDVKVAKITEKGYYFYNGTEWVKSGVGANDQLWAQRPNAEDPSITETYLKPADENGELFRYSKGGVSILGKSANNEAQTSISAYGLTMSRVNDAGYGPALSFTSGKGTLNVLQNTESNNSLGRIYFNPTFTEGTPGYGAMIAGYATDVESASSYGTKLIFAARVKGYTEATPYANMIIGNGAVGINVDPTATTTNSDAKLQVRGNADGKALQILNSSSNPVVTFLTGGNVGIGTDTPTDRLQVIGSAKISNSGNLGGAFNIENTSKTENTQIQRWTFFNTTDTDPNTEGGYNDGLVLWGYNKDTTTPSGPKLMITDGGNLIIGGNYVYSNQVPPTEKLIVQGNTRIEGLKGTSNRPVFADADGKLIIGDATNAATSFKWVEDATNTSVKLAVTSAGVERTDNPVSITDTGLVKATSFQGSNGATIFPDYVFQKYYDGVSDIKADYTFKSLSQVEDFVKTNGHLPGYKSAAEIKNQGYIDLMETQLTNVEKIEELYLHSIEQEKTNKVQAEELKAKDAKIQELEARLEKLEKLLK